MYFDFVCVNPEVFQVSAYPLLSPFAGTTSYLSNVNSVWEHGNTYVLMYTLIKKSLA